MSTSWPQQREGDFVLKDYRFDSGEVLGELRLHYTTIGTLQRNAAGKATNAVLLLHNTSGGSQTWLGPTLAGELFGPGQPLDASRYFLIIPDAIGFGKSSKPSDGLRAKFPKYRYADIVQSQYRLLSEHLGIARLRLLLGISMGGMHAWMWGGMYPELMAGLMPVACQPTPISGRNWLMRRLTIEAIRNDPDWADGNYTKRLGSVARIAPLTYFMTQSVCRIQELAPTRAAADALFDKIVADAKADPADQLYALEAIMEYDPTPGLAKIKAKVLAVNFADDVINTPELGVVEPAIARVPDARYVLMPATPATQGHYTNLRAGLWKGHVAALLSGLGEE